MKIRIGNDFKTKWAITWLGEPEDFSDATDIALFFNIYDKKIELTKDVDYTITDNIIEIDVTPDICNILGVYNLELHYTKPNDDFIDGERRSAVDIDAFRIVGKSDKADATQDVSIISDAVAIFLDIAYKKLEEIEANENIRISNEQDRQTNTATAISNAEQATLNANNSGAYANEQGAYAEEISSHPPTIINDYWHTWNFTTNQYESTGQYARGDSAIDGALVVQEKGQSAVNTMSQKAITDELEIKADHGYESNPKTLKEVEDEIVQLLSTTVNLEEGYFYRIDGEIGDIININKATNLDFVSAILDVEEGDLVSLKGKALNSTRLYAILDEDNRIIDKYSNWSKEGDLSITIPETGAKLIFNSYKTSNPSLKIFKSLRYELDKLREEFLDIDEELYQSVIHPIMGSLDVANGAYVNPGNNIRAVTDVFLKTSMIDSLSVSDGFFIAYYGYNQDNWESFNSQRGAFTSSSISAEDFSSSNYIKIIIRRGGNAVFEDNDMFNIGLTAHLNVPSYMFEQSIYKNNPIIEIGRGSLTNTGKFTDVRTKEAKNSEFYNNFRTNKFIKTGSKMFSIEDSVLSEYIITLFEFDGKFNLIGLKNILEGNTVLYSKTRYIKIRGKRIDDESIETLPNIILTSRGWGDDGLYAYNNAPYKETVGMLIEVGNYNGQNQLEDYDFNLPPEEQAVYNQTDTEPRYTNMILRTPKNYSPNGEPVRVIYFAHSSAGPQATDFYSAYRPYVEYLVDEGYMLIDMFAWDNKMADMFEGAFQYYNTPTNIACVNAMYKFVSDNYNIKRDGVFVVGKSHGGYQAYGVPYLANFKVLASAALGGVLSFAYKSMAYINQERLASFYDLEIPEDASDMMSEQGVNYNQGARTWLRRNAEYFRNRIPLFMGAINFNMVDAFPDEPRKVNDYGIGEAFVDHRDIDFQAIQIVPMKSWISPDDTAVSYHDVEARKAAVDKGFGIFEVRKMPIGSGDSHHTVDTAGPFVDEVKTKYGGTHTNVPVTYVELLQWFKRWEI